MDSLARLTHKLHKVNQHTVSRLKVADSVQILHELHQLKNWLGEEAQGVEATHLTIDEALRIFRERRLLQNVRHIRLVCYGCTQIHGKDHFFVLGNRDYFARLLTEVAQYQNRKRTLRKFYRGLLNSYFSFDPFASSVTLSARENWARLRQFLTEYLARISGGSTPVWLRTLQQHTNLLQENPGQPYVKQALQGDWTEFSALREQLEIAADSWLVREAILAPIRAVVSMREPEFKQALSSALLLLHQNPLYINDGLPLLLDRYQNCDNNQYNQILTDFTLTQWGNPWLKTNRHRWPCSSHSRLMLAHWLKHYLLNEFFTRFCGEALATSRRAQFWSLYSAELSGIYFALSANLLEMNDSPLVKFRQLAKGLIAKLAEDKTDVQVCILQFSHFHVIEFSRSSTPAYFYDTRLGTPPFYFSKGWLDIGALNVHKVVQGAEVSTLAQALSHQDDDQAWEQKFAALLGHSAASLRAFCQQYQCQYEDARTQTGIQWIHAGTHSLPTTAQAVLAGWGFLREAASHSYALRTKVRKAI